ncbi:hypothetical protein M8818_004977 [Zalaria obscura]|uniref:Uncharacterized protein n=1 Tax=Zalaria obscura TaxID=2024903 RepID=A0ACC3SAQ3_9PEZI
MAQSIKTVGVVGTGVIGASWTGLFLAHGLNVLVSDPAPGAEENLDAHLKSIWPVLERLGLSPGASLENYKFVGKSLKGHYHRVDFVQENAPERIDLKTNLIGEIDAETRPGLSVHRSVQKNPGRVLIEYPFNPPHLMPLVEIVPHPGTDPTIVQAALDFYTAMGKCSVLVKQELPGFVANRLQAAVGNEAYSLVKRGVLSAEDLDACMTTSLGPRWAFTGPFMSNVMGGGGGRDGFKHLLGHLGPAAKAWTDDMNAHVYVYNEENLEALDKSVQKMLDDVDAQQVEAQRDDLLINFVEREEGSFSSGLDSSIQRYFTSTLISKNGARWVIIQHIYRWFQGRLRSDMPRVL